MKRDAHPSSTSISDENISGKDQTNYDLDLKSKKVFRGDKLLVVLLGFSVLLAVSQITLGGVVRVTGSGDGCPDWPLCFGSIVPPWSNFHALVEWSHRTTGVALGLVMVGSILRAWRGNAPSKLLYFITSGTILVAIIGGVGGAVVLSELDPVIRTIHLMLAEVSVLIIIFAMVASTNRGITIFDSQGAGKPLTSLLLWGSAIVLLGILSGSYTVLRGAGIFCPSWPLCTGLELPRSELEWIHVIHRLVSAGSAIAAGYASYKAARSPVIFLRIVALLTLLMISSQIFVGAANPWTDFSQWARATHLSIATIIWGLMVLMAAITWKHSLVEREI